MTNSEKLIWAAWGMNKVVILSGEGGSGKTHLIKRIIHHLKLNHIEYRLTATTALAAKNLDIEAVTIHSVVGLFSFFKRKYDELKSKNASREHYRSITNEMLRYSCKKRRVKSHSVWYAKPWFSDNFDNIASLQALILDEYSMLDDVFLETIDRFFREIKFSSAVRNNTSIRDTKLPFGGIRLCLVGDNLQLPPPSGIPIVKGTWIDTVDFARIILDRTFRQDESSKFVEILRKIRTGTLDIENYIDDIQDRIIHEEDLDEEFDEMVANGSKPVVLYARKHKVSSFNHKQLVKMSQRTNQPIKTFSPVISWQPVSKLARKGITATPADIEFCEKKIKEANAYYKLKQLKPTYEGYCYFENKVPVGQLSLCVGAPVMTRINHPEKLFVNGSVGVVTKMDKSTITIDFGPDSPKRIVTIGRMPFRVDARSSAEFCFSQFPVNLFFAMTIHKAQGLTLPSVIVDVRDIFDDGQLYVAASRVRKFKDIFFVHTFTTKAIKVNKELVEFEMIHKKRKKPPVDIFNKSSKK